jgi:2-aminoethylphosphonate-pyruvate transaminase
LDQVIKRLFTPGPLTTSASVKEAMLRDLGSRDAEFLQIVREIREKLLDLGGVSRPDYECVLMQGSGTFAVESVISSAIPREGKLLVLVNGAYGRRMVQIARVHGIAVDAIEVPENQKIRAQDLAIGEGVTHVAVIHCETTTGILNPVEEIGEKVAASGAAFIVDAMSSFGAIPLDLRHVDFVISSANKCIEGAPGFGFILAKRASLEAAKGCARTLSLDLQAQWAGLARDGQFRFTPPTHVLLAFRQALTELEMEGGIAGRAARYSRNHARLVRGMRELGFEPYLANEDQSYIITSFRYPPAPFRFEEFYSRLSDLGFVIYPGKLTHEACFRIGTIGRLDEPDIAELLGAIEAVIAVPVQRA